MFLVDTNHWLFYLDEDAPEHPRVAPRLDALLDQEDLLQTTVIQLEVAHGAFRRWGAQASAPLGIFLALPARVVPLAPEDLQGSVRLLEAHHAGGLGGRDASILHAAQRNGATLLCTGDKGLARAARKLGLDVRDLTAR